MSYRLALRIEALAIFGGTLAPLSRPELRSLHAMHLHRARWASRENCAWHLDQAARCRHALRRLAPRAAA